LLGLVAAGAAGLGCALAGERARGQTPGAPEAARPIDVTARRIDSFSRTGSGRRFGQLEFRGGLVLSSADRQFGGFSGLVVEPDGRRMMAVSDEGSWMSATIAYDGTRPAGLTLARLGPIRGQGGRALDRKRDLDAEAIALVDGNLDRGTVLIGFERNHRVGRFPVVDGALGAPAGYMKLPPEARRMRANKGFEAVTVMAGGPHRGAVVAFSERFPDNPAQHTGWVWIGGEPRRLAFPDIGEFEVTDAASLADGTLLVLERRFRWTEGLRMRVRRFPAAEVRPGAVMQSETLIEADLAQEIDNMEGLAVHRGPRGETVLTLISDDNFSSLLQRTILLQFTLADEGNAAQRT
jgi:hypothetical protein